MRFVHGDLLAEPADYLVSSGNVQLNMSGGANGALLLRYGPSLQAELHAWLAQRKQVNVPPGFCHRFQQTIGAYRGVVYAVGIDGFYESSIELVARTLSSALDLLAPEAGATVAFPAIATGYGRLSKSDFGRALARFAASHPAAASLDLVLVDRRADALEAVRAGYSA